MVVLATQWLASIVPPFERGPLYNSVVVIKFPFAARSATRRSTLVGVTRVTG